MGMQHDPEGQYPPFADHYPVQTAKKVAPKIAKKICVDCGTEIQPLHAMQWAKGNLVIKPLCKTCFGKRQFPVD